MTLWGERLTFEVSSADPDDTPVWVDLSPWLMAKYPLDIRIGRQNDLDQSEPSTVTFTLNNNDDRFTYGNTSSPYAAWWGPGRECRLLETVNGQVLDRFTGYLQTPTETVQVEGRDQIVQVAAVDRLGRLASAEAFVSTLGAHIVYVGGAALKGYWSLNDPNGSTSAQSGVGSPQSLTVERNAFGNGQPIETEDPIVDFGAVAGPPGDDGSYVTLNSRFNASDIVAIDGRLVNRSLSSVTTTATSFLVLAAWMRNPVGARSGLQVFVRDAASVNRLNLVSSAGNPPVDWKALAANAATGPIFTTSLGVMKLDAWHFVSARIDCSATGAVEMWVDEYPALTGTLTGTTVATFDNVGVLLGDGGSVAHVQVYVTSSSAEYDRTTHLAQYQAGLTGLERQSTGDRIRTIARYAGIPDAELDIDVGTTVMQVASLADQTPLQAMREAENTEQGLLYVDGSGVLHFKDRRSLYNI